MTIFPFARLVERPFTDELHLAELARAIDFTSPTATQLINMAKTALPDTLSFLPTRPQPNQYIYPP